MGMPLLAVGASAGRLLPKAGDWLNATKAVFGVILLAVAVWMLSRVVPPAVSQLLLALLLIIPAVYLHALEPLPAGASGWRKLWKGLGLVMLIFGVLQLIGLSAGSTNPLQPMRGLMAATPAQAASGLVFKRIRSVAELDAQLASAKAQGKTVMLDFYADWCVSCKEMEAFTFTDAQVKQRLANTLLLQADVTANSDNDKQLLQRFSLFGPPGIIFFGTDGQERRASRVIGYQDAATFLNTLTGVFSS
jgi:thiol:disulfide interchange protein DsbD